MQVHAIYPILASKASHIAQVHSSSPDYGVGGEGAVLLADRYQIATLEKVHIFQGLLNCFVLSC